MHGRESRPRVAQESLRLSSYATLMGDKEGDAYITGIDCLAILHECLGNIVPHHMFCTIYGGTGSKSKNPEFFERHERQGRVAMGSS